MTRQEYSKCVGEKMKGKQLSRDERKLEFCMSAKLCSGKATNREGAAELCRKAREQKETKKATGQECVCMAGTNPQSLKEIKRVIESYGIQIV